MRKFAGVCALLVAGCLEKNPVFVEPMTTTDAMSGGHDESSTTRPGPPTTGAAEGPTSTTGPEPPDTTMELPPVTTVPPTGCGDGMVDADEACDDGNFIDGDECTNLCTTAVCGDGVHYQDVEQCDDGNLDESDECLSDCTLAFCGDGVVWLGHEQCDDGANQNDDGCEFDCQETVRLVFVSSGTFRASDLGGLDNADKHCQALAVKALLPAGVYRAWLSTDDESPQTRFNPTKYKYVRRDGQPIALNWDDLVDGTLMVPIELDEFGAPGPLSEGPECVQRAVHSNTDAFGDRADLGTDCDGWTDDELITRWGSQISADKWWSDGCANSNLCFRQAPIYCFQQ